MKAYKLIKEYPQSIPLGERVVEGEFGFIREDFIDTDSSKYPIHYRPEKWYSDWKEYWQLEE